MYYIPMTNTVTAGNGTHVHYSVKPGLTLCGKRTEAMDTVTQSVDCAYCISHRPAPASLSAFVL
jgi:hypothetical protein